MVIVRSEGRVQILQFHIVTLTRQRVVENGGVIEDRFTTKYRSVIAFGKIYEETDGERRENAFRLMMRSLTPSVTNEKREEMSHCQKARILAMDIEYLSGKGANQ